jgi:hypothetical protein
MKYLIFISVIFIPLFLYPILVQPTKKVIDVVKADYEYLDIAPHDQNLAFIRRYTLVYAVAEDNTVLKCEESTEIGDLLKGEWVELTKRKPKRVVKKSDGAFDSFDASPYTSQKWIRGEEPEPIIRMQPYTR